MFLVVCVWPCRGFGFTFLGNFSVFLPVPVCLCGAWAGGGLEAAGACPPDADRGKAERRACAFVRYRPGTSSVVLTSMCVRCLRVAGEAPCGARAACRGGCLLRWEASVPSHLSACKGKALFWSVQAFGKLFFWKTFGVRRVEKFSVLDYFEMQLLAENVCAASSAGGRGRRGKRASLTPCPVGLPPSPCRYAALPAWGAGSVYMGCRLIYTGCSFDLHWV